MKVVVTGGLGFVGINAVKLLAAAGHAVVAADRLAPDAVVRRFLAPVAERVQFITDNVLEPAFAEQVAAAPTHILHMATVTEVRPEDEMINPLRQIEVNTMGTVRMLEVARQVRPQRFVYTSSSGLYARDVDPGRPVRETDPIHPAGSFYSVGKYGGELAVERYGAVFGLDAVTARLAGPFGPMERPTGVRPLMGPLYDFAKAAVRGQRVTVTAPDEPRGWSHVEDVAAGLIALLFAPRLSHRLYNVAAGRQATLRSMLDAALPYAAPGFGWEEAAPEAAAPFDARRRYGVDTARLVMDTGFGPRYTPEQGFAAYVRWMRDYVDLV